MTVFFAAQELESFDLFGSGDGFDQAGIFQADSARSALRPNDQTDYFEGIWDAGKVDIWAHWDQRRDTSSGSVSRAVSLHNSSGTEFVRLDATAERLKIWNGADFETITIDLATLLPAGEIHTIDVHVVVNVSGTVTCYVNGTDRGTENLDTSSWTDIASIRNWGAQLFKQFYVSAVIITDEPTPNWRLSTLFANGNGFHTDFVGDFTDIDQFNRSDSDFISSQTPGDIESFTGSDIDAGLTDLHVRAISVGIRSRKQNGGNGVIQAMVRTGAADFFGDSETIIDDGSWHSDHHVFNGNPGGGDWDHATANVVEFGVKHVS